MKKKTAYRLRNWREYNHALTERGSLTVWFGQDLIEHWTTTACTGKRGASDSYTDLAITTMATLQAIYHLPGRATQGLLQSLLRLLQVELTAPHHSTLSRRRARLQLELPLRAGAGPRHLVIDSTGVKVYGEGEWKVRQHGLSKRRSWLKLHLAPDATTGEIVAAVATTCAMSDGEVLPELLAAVEGEIEQVSADGAYDQGTCYAAIKQRNARAAIPPRKGARIWQHGNTKAERHARDENLRRVRQVGRKQWKQESNYHRRSLAETAMFRYKTIFGSSVRTRKVVNQLKELLLKCAALNRITHLGMPQSEKVTS